MSRTDKNVGPISGKVLCPALLLAAQFAQLAARPRNPTKVFSGQGNGQFFRIHEHLFPSNRTVFVCGMPKVGFQELVSTLGHHTKRVPPASCVALAPRAHRRIEILVSRVRVARSTGGPSETTRIRRSGATRSPSCLGSSSAPPLRGSTVGITRRSSSRP